MEWKGLVFLMFVMKIPLVALILLVWWAIRQVPDEDGEPRGDDGGNRRIDPPRPSSPRRPRRGPHGEPSPSAPPRVRTTVVRPRTRDR